MKLKKSFEELEEQKEAFRIKLHQEDRKLSLAHLAAQLGTLMKLFYLNIGNALMIKQVRDVHDSFVSTNLFTNIRQAAT